MRGDSKIIRALADGSSRALFKDYICLFCKRVVLIDEFSRRLFDSDQKTLHIKSCPVRAAHYKGVAEDMAELRRRGRPDPR